jgi:hypothetical protein
MSHVRTLEAVISQVRIPFRPKNDPSRNLAEEIEVSDTKDIRTGYEPIPIVV